MPACSKAVHPSGVEIEFFEDTHKYVSVIDGKELQYVSGTQFLSKYYPVFDPTGKIAERCATREGITVAEIKERWAAKGRESCRLGTRLHETVEDCLLGREYRNTPENEEEARRFNNGKVIGNKLRATVDILGVEKIVFSPDLRIAGTIDLLARSRKDNSYIICDHKTNAEIEKENKYNSFCLSPISHVPAISFHEYSLQLNLYSYLLKREKYVPEDAKFRYFLNHVTPEKYELIELPDRQLEIRDLVIDTLLKERDKDVDIPV